MFFGFGGGGGGIIGKSTAIGAFELFADIFGAGKQPRVANAAIEADMFWSLRRRLLAVWAAAFYGAGLMALLVGAGMVNANEQAAQRARWPIIDRGTAAAIRTRGKRRRRFPIE